MYTAYLLLRAHPPADISVISQRALYLLLRGFVNYTNLDRFRHLNVVASNPVSDSKPSLDHKKLLQRACKGGDYTMVRLVLPLIQPIETFHDFLPIVEAALFARSRDRTKIVKELLGWIKAPLQPFPIEQSSRLMLRCLYLRDWTSAEHVLRTLGANDTFKKYARTEQLMHFCTDAGDVEGVQFLHEHASIDICEYLVPYKVTLGDKLHFDHTPLDLALVKTPSTLEEAEMLMKIAVYMWANVPEPPQCISLKPDVRLSYHLLFESSIIRCTRILRTFLVPGCHIDETMVSILRLMQQMLGDVSIIELDNAGMESEHNIRRKELEVKLTNAFEATLLGYSNISKASQQSYEHDAVAAALVSLTDWILQVYKRSGFNCFGLKELVPEFAEKEHTFGGMSRVLNRHGVLFATGNAQPWA